LTEEQQRALLRSQSADVMRKYQIVMKKDREASKGSNGSQKSKGSNSGIQFNKLRLEQ